MVLVILSAVHDQLREKPPYGIFCENLVLISTTVELTFLETDCTFLDLDRVSALCAPTLLTLKN